MRLAFILTTVALGVPGYREFKDWSYENLDSEESATTPDPPKVPQPMIAIGPLIQRRPYPPPRSEASDSGVTGAEAFKVLMSHPSHISASPDTMRRVAAVDSTASSAFGSFLRDPSSQTADKRRRALSNEVAGRKKQLHSAEEAYGELRAESAGFGKGWKVVMARVPVGRPKWDQRCSEWNIEDHEGKVAIRPNCFPTLYLHGNIDKSVLIVNHLSSQELWTPFKNDEGTWSFQSDHGTWLQAMKNGTVSLETHRLKDEEFWVRAASRPEPPVTENPAPNIPTIGGFLALRNEFPDTGASTAAVQKDPEDDKIALDSDKDRSAKISAQNQRELSKEVAGQRRLQSLERAYGVIASARADSGNRWKPVVSFLNPDNKTCLDWHIDDHEGKVALRPRCAPTNYLRCTKDGKEVEIVGKLSANTLWTPFKSEQGSWSFKSERGTWLQVYVPFTGPGSRVSLALHRKKDEHFWLESWTDDQAFDLDKMDTKRLHFVEAHDSGNDDKDKQADFAKEVAGLRKLRTAHHSYLSFGESEGSGRVFATIADTCAEWYIEELDGKVSLRSHCMPGKYMRSHHGGDVVLNEIRVAHELWTPSKNKDGSWSFQNLYGAWLRAHSDGRVSLQHEHMEETKFWLESWTESAATTAPRLLSSALLTLSREELAQQQSERSKSSRVKLLIIFLSTVLVAGVLLIVIARRRSVARQHSKELSLSYRSLIGDELQP